MIDISLAPFSAVGDGVADDTAAIQAALDAGGHIYVPGGTYRIADTPLYIKERTHLELAPDARIVRDSGPGLIRNRHDGDAFGGYTGRGDILIEGGVWDMRGATAGVTENAASAMTMTHADRITIRDLVILNVPGAHGVDVIGCRNVRIERVTFSGFLADPADTQPRESIQIDGTFASYSGDCSPFDSTPCDDVHITGCRFQASAELPAPQCAVGSHGYLADVSGHEHRHIKVTQNFMADVADAGVVAWGWQESTIALNTIWSPGVNGIVVRDRAWHLNVAHNDIYDAGTSGIYVTGGAVNNIDVHGNKVIGSGQSAHNTHYGICVQASASLIDVTCNRVRKRNAGNHAKYGLFVSGSVTGVQRYGNDLRTSGATGSLSDSSPSPVVSAADAV